MLAQQHCGIVTQDIKVQDENIQGFLYLIPSSLSFMARPFTLAPICENSVAESVRRKI